MLFDESSTTPLEDGSTAVYDASGNLSQIITPTGVVVPADTSIVNDFKNFLGSSLSSAIRSAFAVKPTTPTAPAAPSPAAVAAAQQSQLMRYGFYIVGALLGYKFILKPLLKG